MLRTEKSPERMLFFGPWGAGKTRAWLSIAKVAQQTRSAAKFYALDTDLSVERMLEGDEFKDLSNIELEFGMDWETCDKWVKAVAESVVPGDWAIVDLVGSTWTMVQNYYIEQVFQDDPANYYLKVRQMLTEGSKSLDALSGWTDWTVIKKQYERFMSYLMKAYLKRANIVLVAGSDRLVNPDKEVEDKELRKALASLGVKPDCEKHVPGKVHTVLYFNMVPGTWTVTTIKDRERPYLTGKVLNNFALEYLIPIAGWKL